MKNKDPIDLFYLIGSLTTAEKRYFKLFVAQQSGHSSKVELLYNVIAKQKEYDEKRVLQEASFTNKKLLPELKQHLYQVILRSLRVFHDRGSPKREIKTLLHEVEILYDKGLFTQCSKVLTKVETRCNELEYFVELLEVIYWRLRLIIIYSYSGITTESLINLKKHIHNTLEKINTLYNYNISSSQFFNKTKELYVRNKINLKELDVFIKDNPLFQNEKYANSILSKYYYHNTLGAYYLTTHEFEKCNYHFSTLITIIEQYESWKKINTYAYYNILRNLVAAYMHFHKYNEIKDLLGKIQTLSFSTKQLQVQKRFDIYHLKMELYTHTGAFNQASELVPDIATFIDDYKLYIPRKDYLLICFFCSTLYICVADYKKALYWLKDILNEKDISVAKDIYGLARILQLIIHYELKHYDLLLYLVRNTNRYYSSKKQIFMFEKMIINFFKKLPYIFQQKKLVKLFIKLKEELIYIIQDPFEKEILDYFDFISWLDSKIENRALAEIVKEKAARIED